MSSNKIGRLIYKMILLVLIDICHTNKYSIAKSKRFVEVPGIEPGSCSTTCKRFIYRFRLKFILQLSKEWADRSRASTIQFSKN